MNVRTEVLTCEHHIALQIKYSTKKNLVENSFREQKLFLKEHFSLDFTAWVIPSNIFL